MFSKKSVPMTWIVYTNAVCDVCHILRVWCPACGESWFFPLKAKKSWDKCKKNAGARRRPPQRDPNTKLHTGQSGCAFGYLLSSLLSRTYSTLLFLAGPNTCCPKRIISVRIAKWGSGSKSQESIQRHWDSAKDPYQPCETRLECGY